MGQEARVGMSSLKSLLVGDNQEYVTVTPTGDPALLWPPGTPPRLPTLTMVSVMRSISCLSLVLCCRKGLCLGRRGQSSRLEDRNGETEAGSRNDPCLKPGMVLPLTPRQWWAPLLQLPTWTGLELFSVLSAPPPGLG